MTNVTDPKGNYSDQIRWQGEGIPKEKPGEKKLGQEQFFQLLTQQLAYQDPTNPVNNEQMIAQMTNFSIAEGITGLNQNFDAFATTMKSSMALQASSLVGKKVLLPPSEYTIKTSPEDTTEGVIFLPETTQELKLNIMEGDEVIQRIDLGDFSKGKVPFSWDGTNFDGEQVPAGRYTLVATGLVNGEGQAFSTSMHSTINSVSFLNTDKGVTLNVNRYGAMQLDDVIEVLE
ncbi:flagellar hook assembly protein FlgD [Algicola sagamiensis]|uniref:flagellar hook assembly protein FlgD n=1 Tax=Algicola sagamiensis TaxID=163869 RepID=UPI00037D90E1|nr:flagellar hook assembly protein FlgD [Algicola sagamiensis]